jgi:ribosomal protein L37AE/L43A
MPDAKPEQCPHCTAPAKYLEQVSALAWLCNVCSRVFKKV